MQTVGSRFRSEMNVTPLVDIVLVLLIIFIVITPAVDQAVRLPVARHGRAPQEGPRLVLVLASPGVARLEEEGRSRAFDDLRPGSPLGRLLAGRMAERPDRVLCLKAGASLPFTQVQRLLDLVRESGGTSIEVVTGEDPAGA